MGRDYANWKKWSDAYRKKHRARINKQRSSRRAAKLKTMTKKQRAAFTKGRRAYYKAHDKPYHSARVKRYKLKLKLGIIKAYGGKCTCCGEKDHRFLTLDHVNNDGAKHRQAVHGKRTGPSSVIYRIVRDASYPKDYTVLCFNCNIARSLFGVCPHQEKKS